MVRGNDSLVGMVTVVDENEVELVGAAVTVTWTLPDGSTTVSLGGYTFDAANSVLADSIVK